jgi:polynucleotide 5'-hydroxyl-kinase GRC3/NOL9
METSTSSEDFPFLVNLDLPPEWEAAAGRFLETGGAALVLGAPDTGKSTLCRYLIYRAYAAGERAALIDLDLGQAHLGPPAALGLGFFPPRAPGDEGLFPEGLHFVGQTSPLGAFLEVALGCRTLCDQALAAGLTRVVVNTSGFIQGPGALRLKRAEAELLNPALIFALERHGELQPLLKGLGGGSPGPEGEASGWPLIGLPVSSRAARRAPEVRQAYREERFRRYFKAARRLLLPWPAVAWEGLPLGQGPPLAPQELSRWSRDLKVQALHGESQGFRTLLLLHEAPPARLDELLGPEWAKVHWLSWPSLRYRLVGLLDGRRRTLALGLVLPGPWDPAALALWTPLDAAAAAVVRFLKWGKIRVNLEGREL